MPYLISSNNSRKCIQFMFIIDAIDYCYSCKRNSTFIITPDEFKISWFVIEIKNQNTRQIKLKNIHNSEHKTIHIKEFLMTTSVK